MNVRGVKPRPDPRQLEFNFSPKAVSLKDYADLMVEAIIYGRGVAWVRGGPNLQQLSRNIHGTRSERIIVDDVYGLPSAIPRSNFDSLTRYQLENI